MTDGKLPHINSSSNGDGEERWPRNQSLQTQNRSRYFSSIRVTKPGEAPNSRKFVPLKSNSTVTGTSKSDQTSDSVRVDNFESEEDEEWMCNDNSDDLSLETAKKSEWLSDFLEWFDSLSTDQINDMGKLRCPTCKNRAREIGLFKGFQRVQSKRVRGELRDRKSQFLVGESSKSMGLGEETDDHLIVWPPIVIVQNITCHKDETGQWIGVANSDLRNYFKSSDIRKIQSANGPGGHYRICLLIFDSSAKGYLEAECLHKQFISERRGKYEWENYQSRTHSTGKRLMYGYMATEEDMNLFNKSSRGKQKQNYEMKSYKIMVVDPLKIEKIKGMASSQLDERKFEIEAMEKYYEVRFKQLTEELEKRVNLQEQTIPSSTCGVQPDPKAVE